MVHEYPVYLEICGSLPAKLHFYQNIGSIPHWIGKPVNLHPFINPPGKFKSGFPNFRDKPQKGKQL